MKAIVLLCSGILLAAHAAYADTVVYFYPPTPGTMVGSYGVSTTTIQGIEVKSYVYNSGWTNGGNLFGRNEGTDHGIGICSSTETSSCGTGQGGGDYNEIDNSGTKEIIRLKLPAGYTWVSVQLSSLDMNGSSDPTKWEMGTIWADNNGVPGAPGAIGDAGWSCNFITGPSVPGGNCTYVNGGGSSAVQPIFMVNLPAAPYLFFEARDWTGHSNTDNDFLVMAATIRPIPEPASILLLTTGMTAAVGSMRRKIRQ